MNFDMRGFPARDRAEQRVSAVVRSAGRTALSLAEQAAEEVGAS